MSIDSLFTTLFLKIWILFISFGVALQTRQVAAEVVPVTAL